ncbi:nuclear transport factor 2 family protein [Chachezhania antarctica]|uniref:nuclear transport factor 2 family protein n=1 Tax=Chachezhania antarctica TaxID=2340860 RepID=UPI0013CEA9C7|nr:nuclear transport factor 2 family protein [Chachezhania antarctica]|tara:strand:- start:739 stop:1107 length:369 start_codon:yes stop_codon:yes gene_type:complete
MSEFAAIETVLWDYLDGLYEGDADRLAGIFLPDANLYAVNDEGAATVLPRDTWLDVVRGRTSSKDSGNPSTNQVVWIDVTGTTAVARVLCSFPPNGFTDTLCLLKMAEGWKIIAKTYHVSPV